MGLLDDWELSYAEINELLTDNPSLRSFVSGYAAELKCRKLWFEDQWRVSNVIKYDDHDRTKKGDIAFDYRGHTFTVEVKSLQTNSIRNDSRGHRATFQCDASDKRPVVFSDGSTVTTTCLLVGEFDLLAVNLFGFYGKWVFAFARNEDLPRVLGTRGASKEYTPWQCSQLLATSMPITNPTNSPYELEPWALLDALVAEREAGTAPVAPKVLPIGGGEEALVFPED